MLKKLNFKTVVSILISVSAISAYMALDLDRKNASLQSELQNKKDNFKDNTVDNLAKLAKAEFDKAALYKKLHKNKDAIKSYYKSIKFAQESIKIRRGEIAVNQGDRPAAYVYKQKKIDPNWLNDLTRQHNRHQGYLAKKNAFTSENSAFPLISPDQKSLVIPTYNKLTKKNYFSLYNILNKKRIAGPFEREPSYSFLSVKYAAYNPSGNKVAISIIENQPTNKETKELNQNKTIRIYNTKSGEVSETSLTVQENVNQILFLDEYRLLILIENEVKIWDTRKKESISSLATILETEVNETGLMQTINSHVILINNYDLWREQENGDWLKISSFKDSIPNFSRGNNNNPIITPDGFIAIVSKNKSWLPNWLFNYLFNSYDANHWSTPYIKTTPTLIKVKIVDNRVTTQALEIFIPTNKNEKGHVNLTSHLMIDRAKKIIHFIANHYDISRDLSSLYAMEIHYSGPNYDLNNAYINFEVLSKNQTMSGYEYVGNNSLLLSTLGGELISKVGHELRTTRIAKHITGMVSLENNIIISSSSGCYILNKDKIINNSENERLNYTDKIRDLIINKDRRWNNILAKNESANKNKGDAPLITDNVVDYIDLMTQLELFKLNILETPVKDTHNIIDYFRNLPENDANYWTILIYHLLHDL